MAKRKPKVAKSVKPYSGAGFEALQYEIVDWLNTLTCAVQSLNGCPELDGSDLGSKALSVVRRCDRNLHRLMDDLEKWELQNRPEVAHG